MHRKYEREERGHAEREERPDEEEVSAVFGDVGAEADTLPGHMEDRDGQPKESSKKHDDVPRSPSGKHQRSLHPNDKDGYRGEVREPSLFDPADDVVSQVKCKEDDREQRRDG